MKTEDLFIALTHVATQLTGKWLPVPRTPNGIQHDLNSSMIDKFCTGGFSSLHEDDWHEILEFDASSFLPSLVWLEPMLRSKRLSISVLAEAAAIHFSSTQHAGGQTITINSAQYPELLKNIAKPPLCLSILGNLDRISEDRIAVIGSRKASYQSLRAAVDVGICLAETSWGVVSGGAIGCDIAVHEGMLASNIQELSAIVVFAGGLHSKFPRCNERAFRDLYNRGGVFISERLWFQDVLPRDFPARNRIVSGLTSATVVMAAAIRSGSLITAQEALEQGRDVFVYDQDDQDVRLDGSKKLLQDGAYPFRSALELMEILADSYDSSQTAISARQTTTCQSSSYLGTFDTELKIH
jgi:DNA protecting protein DprA